MSQRIISILFVSLFAATYPGHAQNSPGLTTVVPASPNASALGKYGEIPVSMYTGVPNTNIPLYTLKGRELEVPITLNYHAGGVRVEEIASMVGIGWSLNAGGIISRAIRGMPDDVLGGYFGNHVNTTILAEKYFGNIDASNSLEVGSGNGADSDMTILEPYRENIQDGQPDIFYFNFGKFSGQFFMNQSGQFVVSPLQALKVQYVTSSANEGRISQWILTTPDGVQYVFGTSMDGTRQAWENNDNPSPWGVSTTGWYLMDIISPHNDKISLNYTNISYSYESRSAEVIQTIVGEQNGGTTSPLPGRDLEIMTNDMTVPRLVSISSSDGTVVFTAGAARTDLPGENSLGSIAIYNNQSSTTPLKSWQFYYDYSTNRLTLDSLREYSGDGTVYAGSYTFAYNGSLPDPDPNGLAINSQDLWGYYNGVNNTVFPQGYTTSTADFGQLTIQGADRHSDSVYMQYGTMYKITYPTGGYSQFDYEANQVFTTVANSSIPTAGVPEIAGETAYTYNSNWSDTFTVVYPNPQTGTVLVTSTTMSMEGDGCPTDGNGFSQCYYATLQGIDGATAPISEFPDGTQTFALLPGTYVISGQGTQLQGQNSSDIYRFYFTWTEYPPASSDPNQMVNKPIGGLRVKRITNYDGVSTNVTRYEYNLFNDTASSGVLVNQPYNYANVFEQEGEVCNPNGGGAELTSDTYLQLRGYPLIPLMPTQSAAIGYQNVTKLEGENGENGKEEYTYTTANNYPDVLEQFRPYAPSCGFDWRRGQLLHSTTYKNNNGTFIPVKATSNQYINGIKQTAGYGLAVQTDMTVIPSDCPYALELAGSDYFVGSFQTISEFQYLQSDTNWVYDQNNSSSYVQTIHNYNYDTIQGHYQLTKSVTTDSKNQVEETDYQYPQDLTLTGYEETARESLISQFILTPVLDKKTIRNGVQTTDTKNNYMVFNNGFPLPQSIDVQVGNYPLDRRIDFLQYDNYGNLASQQKANDFLNTFIWDYSQSYPIASVVNADSADVAYTSFEANGSGGWTIGAGAVDPATAVTGTNSYNLSSGSTISASGLTSSTTYIVSYWTMNNSAFSISGTISGYPVQGKTETINGQSWTLYVHKVTGQTTITVSGSGHIDELRLYPSTAQMTTYTYSPLVGMTSQADVGNRVTYYEYDGLARLKRILDQDYNILKTYEYQYQVPAGCNGCQSLAMETFLGSNTIGYPVGVFDIHGNLVGNAAGASAYVSLWNSDTADARVGTLSTGNDSLHFNIVVNAGQILPANVTGCRYFQVDLAYTNIDGVRNFNGTYVDFGDGTGMHLGTGLLDTPAVIAPNTTHATQAVDVGYTIYPGVEYDHTYPNSNQKTLTFYHNDAAERSDFDNLYAPASSLTQLKNLRGNLPINTPNIGGSCYQQSTMSSVANITNWSSIHSIQNFRLNNGDNTNPCENIGYAQDFLANDPGLVSIATAWAIHRPGNGDSTFKLSRLKSNWNTYFTQLQSIGINEDDWNHEDISGLTNLLVFQLIASGQVQADGSSPLVPLDSTEIDNIINQIAAGAGQSVRNGSINIVTGGTSPTSNSAAAITTLTSKGWTIVINTTAR